MNVVSLCSGVGLLDLGLEWAGWRTRQVCEIDPWCRGILQQRFPDAAIHDDVWTLQPDPCDLIAAGFPCQPLSLAGQRRGQDDDRWLWPAVARSVRLARPRYVLLENVPGITSLGLGDVLRDLAGLGFDAEWTVLGAWQVGALHRRNRWWLVATSDADQAERWDEHGGFFRPGWADEALAWAYGEARHVADTGSVGRFGRASLEGTRRETPERGETLDHPRDEGRTHPAGPLADASGEPGWADAPGRVNGDGDRAGREEADGGPLIRGETQLVADTDEERRREGLGIPAGRRVAWCRHLVGTGADTHVADPHEERRDRGTGLQGTVERPEPPDSGQRGDRGEPQPGLGRAVDGSAPRVDGPLLPAEWIDGTWESGVPRVSTRSDHRGERNSALGNGVVPQCVELVGLRIRQLDVRDGGVDA